MAKIQYFTELDALYSDLSDVLYDQISVATVLADSFTMKNPAGAGIVFAGSHLADGNTIRPDAIVTTATIFDSLSNSLIRYSGLKVTAGSVLAAFDQTIIEGTDLLEKGNDVVTGTAAYNSMVGGAGNDTMFGLGGIDYLDGGDGRDRLFGGSGNDHFFGSAGRDTMTGGAGHDTFHFYSGDGRDVITDFHASGTGQDHISLSQALYDGMTKHLVTNTVTHLVTGLELDFLGAGNTDLGSIILQGVTALDAISRSDFFLE